MQQNTEVKLKLSITQASAKLFQTTFQIAGWTIITYKELRDVVKLANCYYIAFKRGYLNEGVSLQIWQHFLINSSQVMKMKNNFLEILSILVCCIMW